MNRQEKEFYKSFAEHGIGEAKVCISPKEVLVLLYITATDLRLQIPTYESDKYLEVSAKGFYYISHEDVLKLAQPLKKNEYGQYLLRLIGESR